MTIKSYIAVFLALIFFGKLVVIDAKFLEVILDSTEVTYVNPFCEMNKIELSEAGVALDFLSTSTSQSVALDSFCNAPFQFEIITWNQLQVQALYQDYSYTSPDKPQIFRDRFYPPPKVV